MGWAFGSKSYVGKTHCDHQKGGLVVLVSYIVGILLVMGLAFLALLMTTLKNATLSLSLVVLCSSISIR